MNFKPVSDPPLRIDSTITLTVDQMKVALIDYFRRQGVSVTEIKTIDPIYGGQRSETMEGYKLNVNLGGIVNGPVYRGDNYAGER